MDHSLYFLSGVYQTYFNMMKSENFFTGHSIHPPQFVTAIPDSVNYQPLILNNNQILFVGIHRFHFGPACTVISLYQVVLIQLGIVFKMKLGVMVFHYLYLGGCVSGYKGIGGVYESDYAQSKSNHIWCFQCQLWCCGVNGCE